MNTLLNAVIPVFGLMLAGFAAGRFGVRGAGSFVLAERYGTEADENSTASVISTALSILTLGFLLVRFSA